jgi:hypothetical protein
MIIKYQRNIDTAHIVGMMEISEDRQEVLTGALPAEYVVEYELEYSPASAEIKDSRGDCISPPCGAECDIVESKGVPFEFESSLVLNTQSREITAFYDTHELDEKEWVRECMMEDVECYLEEV